MREILGRRRRLLSRWNFGLRSGGNDERSSGAGSARTRRANRSGGSATTSARGAATAGVTGAATPGAGTVDPVGTTGEADTTTADGAVPAAAGGPRGVRFLSSGRAGGGSWSVGGRGRTGGRSGKNRPGGRKGRADTLSTALAVATEWGWPVLPGVGLQQRTVGLPPRTSARCACPDPECTVPGAHPLDPGLLAATTDERMVRWWWTNRPTAPIVLATGGRAPCAVSLPAVAGARALAALDRQDIRLGPVIASLDRWAILVAPYSLERLGELLYSKDFVPGSLRFHGAGGYLALPPSRTGQGPVRWQRAPLPGSAAPWVPDVEAVVDTVVDALGHRGVGAPEM